MQLGALAAFPPSDPSSIGSVRSERGAKEYWPLQATSDLMGTKKKNSLDASFCRRDEPLSLKEIQRETTYQFIQGSQTTIVLDDYNPGQSLRNTRNKKVERVSCHPEEKHDGQTKRCQQHVCWWRSQKRHRANTSVTSNTY